LNKPNQSPDETTTKRRNENIKKHRLNEKFKVTSEKLQCEV
ncbi:unnamed protein product, partial [marine sediment metagenome]